MLKKIGGTQSGRPNPQKTNFHWLHVDAEDTSVAGKEPGVFVRCHFMRIPNRA
jgi:hypothetical protein